MYFSHNYALDFLLSLYHQVKNITISFYKKYTKEKNILCLSVIYDFCKIVNKLNHANYCFSIKQNIIFLNTNRSRILETYLSFESEKKFDFSFTSHSCNETSLAKNIG